MFKEFAVRDILPPINIKKYAKKPETEGNIPFVSCQTTNNGIATYCGEAPEVNHCITVSTNGNCFDCFWHNYPIIPSSDVEVLHKDGITDDEKISLYLCGLLAPNTHLYSYSNKPKNGKVFDTKLTLPVIESPNPDHEYTVDDIDWQYMRDRITELERDRITELDAYLQATGLNDYELTEDDKKILSLSAKRASDEDRTLEDDSEDEVRFGSFKLGQLFESQTGDVDLQQKDVNDKGYFFINSGVENRGIKGKTDRPAKVFKAGTITIDFWGNAYYRDFDYVMATHNHVFSLSGDVIKNEKIGHYIIGKLSKLPQLFSYSNMATWNKLKVLDISLPIKSDASDDYTTDDIDFDYMERYIRAMEKVVIAEVVKYKDKVVETTKAVVGM